MESMITVGRIIAIWALAWLLLLITRNFIQLFKSRVLARLKARSDHSRVDTLAGVIRHAVGFLIIGVAVMLSLDEIGFSIAPLLATAGIAGVAIGFGAQNLVKDFISGLFILIEGQVSEGDMVEAGGKSGIVEEVTLRHIRLRDEAGNVHYIPNGMINVISNSSRGYAFAVVDIPVARDTDPDMVFALMQSTTAEMHADHEFGTALSGEVVIDGIEKLDASSMVLRCRIQTVPGKQSVIRREFLRRIRNALAARAKETQ